MKCWTCGGTTFAPLPYDTTTNEYCTACGTPKPQEDPR